MNRPEEALTLLLLSIQTLKSTDDVRQVLQCSWTALYPIKYVFEYGIFTCVHDLILH